LLMRILYFSRDYTTHDRRFLYKLSESLHEVWYLRLEDDGISYEKRSLPERIQPIEWQGGKGPVDSPEAWFRLMPEFQFVLESVKPDLIHAGPVQSCGFMSAMAGFHPFLVVSWGSDILVDADKDEMWSWMTRYTLKHSDSLLCDCQAVRDKVQQIVPYEDERIVQFPWGIDLSIFTPGNDSLELRNIEGWKESFVVLSTRSWEGIYGVDILLNAFQVAYARNKKLRLVLLGDGPLHPEINHFIANHGLIDVVYRPGMVSHEQMSEYYRAADLYMSCALSDGTSISLLEAFASGLAVIITDRPGNREWVVQDRNGWLASVGDPDAFAHFLLLAAEMDVDERRRICETNRRIAEEKANWEVNFGSLLNAYDRIEARYYS